MQESADGHDAERATIAPVTSFFGDGDLSETLKQRVFPEIVRRKRLGGAIRIWSIGCSTGEEPYAILIALFEYLAQRDRSDLPIQLFGTDISAKAIEKARAGLFSHAAMQDVGAERRARFFTNLDADGYRISKPVRERCAFSVQDIATAPPFSRLDLIFCRDILPVFGHELRSRVLAKLRRALDEPGFLVLGRGENIADGANPFTPIDEANRIFARTPVKSGLPAAPAALQRAPISSPRPDDFARLEDELRATQEHLRWTIDEHQRANEELLSANEELLSSNEELQSLNAELHAAKEEIQSTNEELSMLNGEMQARNTELRSVNGDLLNILASVEVPIVIVDADRRIRRFTPKAGRILNIVPEDVGRPIDDLTPNVFVENLDGKVADVIDAVAPHEEEVQGREGRWYRLQIRPYTTVDGKIDGAVLSLVDIDILKRALGAAEWARDYANATVEAVQVPLVVLTETLAISSTNQAFKERYGAWQTPGQAGGVVEAILGNPALRAVLVSVRQRNESFEGFALDCELPGLGRRCMSLSARAVPMPETGRLILLAIEDITGRRRDEKERAQLLRETQVAKASAEAANRTKDIFLATLSHELRTPLATLLLSAELLRSGMLAEDKIQRTVESMLRATKVQAQLIDDLFDVSRIVTGKLKMELRSVSVAACVQAAVEGVTSAVEAKELELEVELDLSLPPVPGDPVRLQQVVSNLLTNAIKFTPARGRVRLTVEAAGDRAQIRVADTGVGIDADFLPRLFGSFSQEDRGETRTHGGLGLGLAIVRHLVEAHGGTVRADSAGKGKGATFTVSIPRHQEAP